jgi:sortase (surface protein transpeptidase)
MRGRTALVAVVALGVTVAIGVPVGWSLADHPTDPPTVNAGTATSLATAPDPSTTTRAPAVTPPSWPGPPIPISRTGGQRSAAGAVPTRLQVPALDIDAPITPVGVDSAGQVQIPEDVHTLGWYQWGRSVGAASGSVVVVGHVDSARQGVGALFDLRSIAAGAEVVVTAGNRRYVYQVIAREEFVKNAVPWPALFATTGRTRLTLVTCGGAFDRTTKSYVDNIVVTAVPR